MFLLLRLYLPPPEIGFRFESTSNQHRFQGKPHMKTQILPIPIPLIAIALFCVCGSLWAQATPPRDHLCLWLDANRARSLQTGDHGGVKKWKNLASDTAHAFQDAADLRPALVENTLNDRNVVRFDGNAYLEVPEIREAAGDMTAFVVSRRSRSQASDKKWQRLISCWVSGVKNDRTLPCFQLPAGEKGSGESYRATVDKVALGGVKIGPLTIGANRQHKSGKFSGDIAEVLIYDQGFSAPEDLHAVQNYLKEKWNASLSREDMGWTRVGPLGETPKRITDALPLSEQQADDRWEVYEPLTDEFEAPDLDSNKWLPTHMRWKGRQPALFWEENVKLEDGKLHLTMRKEEAPDMPKGYHDYTSACVHAKETVKYGYFEVKARPMASAGSSSFWFRNSTQDWVTEIDVYEIGARSPGFERKLNMNLHVVRTPTEKKHWSCGGKWIAPWDLGDNYHVYALDWNEKRIKYYVDGVVVRSVPNTHWHQPLYMIFDSETMPDWFGMPEDEDLPSTYKVEYVRAWKRK